jgi:hypothetical protein
MVGTPACTAAALAAATGMGTSNSCAAANPKSKSCEQHWSECRGEVAMHERRSLVSGEHLPTTDLFRTRGNAIQELMVLNG